MFSDKFMCALLKNIAYFPLLSLCHFKAIFKYNIPPNMNKYELRLVNKMPIALKSYFPSHMVSRKWVDASAGKSMKPLLFLQYLHGHSVALLVTEHHLKITPSLYLCKLCSFPCPQFIPLSHLKHSTNWAQSQCSLSRKSEISCKSISTPGKNKW